MINFRFHIVSLVAVFLALAAGIVIGSTVVDTAVVDGLRDRINTVEDRADQTNRENRELTSRIGQLSAEAEGTGPYAVDGALNGVPVAVVATRGTDEHKIDALMARVRDADGTAPAVIWLEPSWALADKDARDRLAAIVGGSTANVQRLRARGLDLLGERLGEPRRVDDGSGTTTPARDALEQLAEAGFVTVDVQPGFDASEIDAWPGADGRAVVVGGDGQKVAVEDLSAQVARALTRADVATVAADVYSTDEQQPRGRRLAALRASDDLSRIVSTVDDLDQYGGAVASVLALHDIVSGTVGHYGYGEGAQRPLPVWNRG